MATRVSDPGSDATKTPRINGNAKLGASPRAPRTEIDRRIAHIADLMVDGRWIPRRSAASLADEWAVSLSSIAEYAATASVVVRVGLGTKEEIQTRVLALLDRISILALHKGKYGEATRAAIGLATVAGVVAPTQVRQEISGPDGGPIQTAGVVVLPALDVDEP